MIDSLICCLATFLPDSGPGGGPVHVFGQLLRAIYFPDLVSGHFFSGRLSSHNRNVPATLPL